MSLNPFKPSTSRGRESGGARRKERREDERRDQREEIKGVIRVERRESEPGKSEKPDFKIRYWEVKKGLPVYPILNEEKELTLDGKPMDQGVWHKAKKTWNKVTGKDIGPEVMPDQSIIAKSRPSDYIGNSYPPTKRMSCWGCIESANVQFDCPSVTGAIGSEAFPKSRVLPLNEDIYMPGYLQACAISSLYNHGFGAASRYLKRGSPTPPTHDIDSVLISLECDISRKECSYLEAKCREFDATLEMTEDISLGDLLHWIVELRCNDRHYAAFLLCRALSLRLPVTDTSCSTWYFNLCYFVFVEMSLRAVYVLGRKTGYFNVTNFILGSMYRVIEKMKLYLDEEESSAYEREKIAICYLSLSYCCNSVSLYESAERLTDDGKDILRNRSQQNYLQYKIYADLLINKAVSFLGRGNVTKASENIYKALEKFQKETIFFNQNVKKWRIGLTHKLAKRLHEETTTTKKNVPSAREKRRTT